MNELLECVTIEPRGVARASVIWLHGLGADGHDFEGLVPELRLPESLGARFVLPHAPQRAVTLNAGYVMRAWYDLYALDFTRGEDEPGIRAATAGLARLIAHETARGIASNRILLAGFSQGGALALHGALRHPEPLAGVLALSTYLSRAASLATEAHPANRATPILLAHGLADEVVTPVAARHAHQQLAALGYPVTLREYAMGHALCPQEIADIRAFLIERLS
jgi:phospholipase/carboxylesterase